MGGKFFALTDGVQVGKVVGNEGADLDQVVGSNPSGQKRLVSVTECGVRLYNKNVNWLSVNVWAQRSPSSILSLMVSGSEVILTTAKNKFEKLEQPKSLI